jgi:DNA-binding LytR/AlgR family response regulator
MAAGPSDSADPSALVDPASSALSALVVDDERPARDELEYLLSLDPRVGRVRQSGSAADALRMLDAERADVVFLDIAMPGLDGVELARVLSHYKRPPAVVFVTAHDEFALAAFELNAVDYLLKPVATERVGEAIRRVVDVSRQPGPVAVDDETLPVELGGVTRFILRSEIRYVESQGDYTRLHTGTDSHLVRISMAELQERWRDAGFVRIHRQCLVAIPHVTQVRQDGGHVAVVVDGTELVVSRRHVRELRDLLLRGRRTAGDS